MQPPIRVRQITKWFGLAAAVLTFMAWLTSLTMLHYGEAKSLYGSRFAHVYVTNGGIVAFVCRSNEPWTDPISLHEHAWRRAGFILPTLTTRSAYGLGSELVGLSTWEQDSDTGQASVGTQRTTVVGILRAFFLPFWVPLILILVPTCILWWLDVPFRTQGGMVCENDLRQNMNGVCPARSSATSAGREAPHSESAADSTARLDSPV